MIVSGVNQLKELLDLQMFGRVDIDISGACGLLHLYRLSLCIIRTSPQIWAVKGAAYDIQKHTFKTFS